MTVVMVLTLDKHAVDMFDDWNDRIQWTSLTNAGAAIAACRELAGLQQIHWNENVVVLMKSSSLAALKVVKMTTFSAASDENFIKMTTFPFQCCSWYYVFLAATKQH